MRTTSATSTTEPNSTINVSKPSKWLLPSLISNKSFKLISQLPRRLTKIRKSHLPQTTTKQPVSSLPVVDPISPLDSSKGWSSKQQDDRYIQLQEQVFRHFDGDGDGKISSLELRSYFASVGEYMSNEEAQGAIDDLDRDGDGLLDFREFLMLMKKKNNGGTCAGQDMNNDEELDISIKQAFEMFGVEKGSGSITPKSLQRMLNRLGDEKTYNECVAMIRVYDLDDNGLLDFNEFLRMMA